MVAEVCDDDGDGSLRQHLTDPRTTLSIMRALPDGDWRCGVRIRRFLVEFPVRYDRLECALRAADELVNTQRDHEGEVSD